ncbi:MAG: hypothetical protein AB1644_08985 [Candidatus Zixiibacteriota bacterium]
MTEYSYYVYDGRVESFRGEHGFLANVPPFIMVEIRYIASVQYANHLKTLLERSNSQKILLSCDLLDSKRSKAVESFTSLPGISRHGFAAVLDSSRCSIDLAVDSAVRFGQWEYWIYGCLSEANVPQALEALSSSESEWDLARTGLFDFLVNWSYDDQSFFIWEFREDRCEALLQFLEIELSLKRAHPIDTSVDRPAPYGYGWIFKLFGKK